MTSDASPAECVPANSVPANSVPADSVPADSVPADSVPADSVPADSVPADSVPADSVPADSVPADSVPADGVPASSVPASSLPANSVPANCAPQSFKSMSEVMRANSKLCVPERHQQLAVKLAREAILGEEVMLLQSTLTGVRSGFKALLAEGMAKLKHILLLQFPTVTSPEFEVIWSTAWKE